MGKHPHSRRRRMQRETYYDFGSVKGSIPGGDLKETTYFTECGEVEDGQEYNMQCKSIIEGTWKIEVGDIYFTYDLSTLKVTFEGISFPGADRLYRISCIKVLLKTMGNHSFKNQ